MFPFIPMLLLSIVHYSFQYLAAEKVVIMETKKLRKIKHETKQLNGYNNKNQNKHISM